MLKMPVAGATIERFHKALQIKSKLAPHSPTQGVLFMDHLHVKNATS